MLAVVSNGGITIIMRLWVMVVMVMVIVRMGHDGAEVHDSVARWVMLVVSS